MRGMTVGGTMLALGLAIALPTPGTGQGSHEWVPSTCVKPDNYLVNSGLLYLKSAAQGRYDEQIKKDLRDANRTLLQAITSGSQDKNPAAWYYLARYYVAVSDPIGADSAFTKAEQLLPACKGDIAHWRRDIVWVPLYNAGVAAINGGKSDSAIYYFQRANAIYSAEPTGFKVLASLFFNSDQPDSAAKYFRLAATVAGTDPKWAQDRKESTFNLAASLQRGQHFDEAEAIYRDYLKTAPNDGLALVQLAQLYGSAGKADSAKAIFATIVQRADSLDANTTFAAGAAMYDMAPKPADTAATGGTCRANARRHTPPLTARAIVARCDSVTRREMAASDADAAQYFRQAATAFEATLKKIPGHRDALYNLANVYYVLRDTSRMLPTAQQLAGIDPMNRTVLRMVAQGWQFRRHADSTLHYLAVADSLLPLELVVSRFDAKDSSATVSGLATNFHTKRSDSLKVTFEFLTVQGDVVASEPITIPPVDPSGNAPFQALANKAGIVAWRYKRT